MSIRAVLDGGRAAPVLAVPIVVGALALLAAASAPGSTPPTGSVTVPASPATVTDTWTGEALPGANPTSSCAPPSSSPVDEHVVTVNVAPGAYDVIDAAFRFSITWTPTSSDVSTSDLILTVIGPDGEEVDSSDGGSPSETVNANNLPAGDYRVLVCGFANTNTQPYNGRLDVTTTTRTVEVSLPSAPAQGLAFSASVAADNQRDEAEPLLEIDKAGNVYDCGPTGFSNASDYAQVSTDGGDQFHLLGTPPRGQQGAGGGGDCGLAFGTQRNSRGNFQYAYTGLGPLTGFVTSTSPNNGKSLATGGPFANGVTDEGGGADRQWMTFVGEQEVLLIYNQQVPRNVVVQRSTDGGLTYGPFAERAARTPRFPGPIRYIEPSAAHPQGVVYFPWDRGAPTGNQINVSFSTDKGATWRNCGGAVAPGTTTLFVTADHDNAGNIYVVYGENAKFHTYMITTSAAKLVANCTENPAASSTLPSLVPAAFSTPVQVDRDAIRSTVFQWVTAGGEPGRVAVVFAGTETDGNPNSGNFNATWHIYVNQSLNALSTDPASPPTFSQVQATTHPFHYDSICLNGLGCDLSIPPGDRSMADFFSLDFNPVDKKLYVTFNRSNKKPDEDIGHIATPMVVTQIGGPSLGGGTISSARQVLRSSSADPPADALSSYSTLGVGVTPSDPPTMNEPAGDFLSVSIGPEIDLHTGVVVANHGITVTMKVADLSNTSLLDTAARTRSQSLLWLLRFSNGHQDAAAAARWNPVQGFTFGYNDFTTGVTPCAPAGPGSAASEKCLLYPGDTPIQGDVDQANGTIRLSVPRFLLRGLSGSTGPGERPSEVAAAVGTRFYDATAFSLGNPASPIQAVQSFLYPLDNTPSMDFLLPAAGGGGGGGETGCRGNGGGTLQSGAKFSFDVHADLRGKIDVRDAGIDFRSVAISRVSCPATNRIVVEGSGFDGNDAVTFTVTAVDGGEKSSSDSFSVQLSNGKSRSGSLVKGNIQVKR